MIMPSITTGSETEPFGSIFHGDQPLVAESAASDR
jgi:hypothetical protein